MKYLLLLIALIAASSALVFAQPAKNKKNNFASAKNKAESVRIKTENEIRLILNERIDALRDSANIIEGINAWNDKYFNKDAITTTTTNRVLTGEQKLSNDKKETVPAALKITSVALDQETISIFGDTVVANYRWTLTASLNNRRTEEATLFTSVFARRNGKWQVIAEHVSRIR
ncbi:MAG TPA: nuclear transport factor 2 family protein [Pyrinomonadaceae bacterium]|jgi:ketosteroid isomerase-like protein